MLGAGHPNAAEIRDLTSDLRSLHTHFESRFEERKKLLESTFDFYNVSYEVGVVYRTQFLIWYYLLYIMHIIKLITAHVHDILLL